MKYIILLKAKGKEEIEASKSSVQDPYKLELNVGHVIVIPNTETKVNVTAIGKDGVTAQDDEGNKFLIRHENVKTEEEVEEDADDGKKEEEVEQREKIKVSLDDLLNKKEHKKGTKFDTKESHDKDKKKIDETTVEGYLKKNIKKDGWVQTSTIAKLMDIKTNEADEQLKDLKERGILQLIADSDLNGDILYKYVNNERGESEAKPASYSKDPFDRLKKKPKDEDEKELPNSNIKKIKPSDIWR
jgi:ribosomal protein S25